MTTALDQNELKLLLAETEAFSALSVEELAQCASLLELVHYSLGEQVCQTGEEADAFYLVYSGRARVVAQSERGEELRAPARRCRAYLIPRCLSINWLVRFKFLFSLIVNHLKSMFK